MKTRGKNKLEGRKEGRKEVMGRKGEGAML